MYSELMPLPLLTTKLYTPPVRAGVLSRAHLLHLIQSGQEGKLTLVSAPAGFGKSTLVSRWAADHGASVAWLSLDEHDRDPIRLLTYLVAAVQSIQPDFGQTLMSILSGPDVPQLDAATTELINNLNGLTSPITLVLDDWHSAQTVVTGQILRTLVDYLPTTARIVMTTREQPELALSKLRAKGDLTEINASDLRFTTQEVAEYLNQSMHLDVPDQGIAALEKSTEGWVTGLQLAALSLRADVSLEELLSQLQQGHQYIVEYLLDDVLLKQPEPVQRFLLNTASLGRFCVPLCEAVFDSMVGDESERSCKEILELVERENLFVVPLDAERKWYRYHHLFSELLRKRLRSQSPDVVPELHLRASKWFLSEGLELEAFEHAAAARDPDLSLKIINGGIVPLQFRGGVFPIIKWLECLSTEDMNQTPELWVTWASSLLALGQVEGVLDKAEAAECALRAQSAHQSDLEILGRIASIRASVAVTQHDHEAILRQSEIALKYLDASSLVARVPVTWAIGYAHALRQELVQAEIAYSESLVVCNQIGFSTIGNMCRLGLSKIWLENLKLQQVVEVCQDIFDHVGDSPPPTTCDAHLALGMVHYYWDDLDQAEQCAKRALPMAQQIQNTDRAACCELFMAQIALAKGDLVLAESQLIEAEGIIRQYGYDLQRPYMARLQLWLAIQQQDFSRAEYWAGQQPGGHSRIVALVSLGELDSARALLSDDTEPPATLLKQVQNQLSHALLYHAADEISMASACLENALILAEPANALRLFLDEGRPMKQLLQKSDAAHLRSAFGLRLLHQFNQPNPKVEATDSNGQRSFGTEAEPLNEPITKREREVLTLLAEGLSNQEISLRLHRALSTIKGHNQSIFEKLKVQRRTEAIAKARDLGLIE